MIWVAQRLAALAVSRLASREKSILENKAHSAIIFLHIKERNMTNPAKTAKTPEAARKAIISMAVESWRFGRVFERLLSRLDAGEQNRYQSQFRWFIKKMEEALEQADLKIVNLEGQHFDPGMAATPLNIEEFDAQDTLIVEQMLEPVIMGKEGLVKTGTVTLKKAAQ